ncbi:DUF202 domain-containing protein [Stenotrophomonas sp. PFBMAA-4]|uniref:YidH family protein n=1 Tax=Stenotrophomonas sp. PFBMAA-4 TaxID=3043301 RepID=UPI0024B5D956|nr:DUF202 domain-containing protein [Stenotrophomonas sp. PFBMAA-4]MDI9271825.1 DUF202 domain-containing protein [Stenotrophomonas sp. PFBMAA-4]
MSFERTRMSADRTLMSIMRTSLSLIGFGFTLFQFFRYLADIGSPKLSEGGPARFGIAMVSIGVVLMALGIWKHVRFMRRLRRDRAAMQEAGLLHRDQPDLEYSVTLLIAICLLLLGISAVCHMAFNIGPLD